MKYSEAAAIALIEGGEAKRVGGWIVKGRVTTLDQLIQVLEEGLQADDWYVAVSCKNPAAKLDKGYIGGLLWERFLLIGGAGMSRNSWRSCMSKKLRFTI